MRPAKRARLPVRMDYSQFKTLLRAELSKLGVVGFKFKVNRATGGLEVLLDIEVDEIRQHLERVQDRVLALGDRYGILVAVVPGSYIQGEIG